MCRQHLETVNMSYYKTVTSVSGKKDHVAQEQSNSEIRVLCHTNVEVGETSELWSNKQRIYKADDVCENCKHRLFDEEVDIQRFKMDDNGEDNSEDEGLIDKLVSILP